MIFRTLLRRWVKIGPFAERWVGGAWFFIIQRMSKSLAKVRVRNVRKVFSSVVVGLGDKSSSVNISSLLLEEAKKIG